MKKLLSFLMALTLVLGLCACGEAAPTPSTAETAPPSLVLQAGYAKVDITPSDPVPITADGEVMHSGLLDYLYATCLYLTDTDGTELYLIALDQCNMYPPLPEFRLELAKALGVAEEQVMFSASHTHSAVKLRATGVPSVVRYISALKQNLEKVARQAKADAKTVTGMFTTSAHPHGLNFVRRYVMADGSYAGDNYGNHDLEFTAHESEGDRQLQLLKFTRERGKDIILTNFQTHPHRTAYDTDDNTCLSSDIVGAYRDSLEQQLGCLAMYYTGASGNVNPTSRIPEENIHKNHRTHGKAMADYAVEAAADFTPVALGPIRIAKTVYTAQCYHSEDTKLKEAEIVAQRFDSGLGNAASLKGYEDLFVHSRHAIAVVSRASLPETQDVALYGFSVGGFAACYAPFEMFAELGVQLKEASPFQATFVCCLSNEIHSYLPTKEAFAIGGYGPYKCNYEPGTGENVVETFVQLLNGLHSS